MSSFLAFLFHCLCCSFQSNFLLSFKMTCILADSSIQSFKRRVGYLLVLQIFSIYFILLCEKSKDYFSLLLEAVHWTFPLARWSDPIKTVYDCICQNQIHLGCAFHSSQWVTSAYSRINMSWLIFNMQWLATYRRMWIEKT